MAKGSDNPFPSVLIVEGAAPTSPPAGNQRLFIDSADHKLKRVNSSGTVTNVESTSASKLAARVIQTTNQSIPNATLTALTWSSATFDDGPYWSSGSPTRLTVPSAGRYVVTTTCAWASNATGVRGIVARISGGTSYAWGDTLTAVTTVDTTRVHLSTGVLNLTTSDYIEIYVFQDSGAALNTAADANSVWASITQN